ncbi:peptidoglycan DD-metalloendopeptidase family protein [Saccharicrinis sp. FJH62]|uniref:peptidoglycan DD-metalloendopeptidase family protein n=1 Tax=Saccharicrinis sp. FJH62 TaxID=3344657 RepID=UPI0035D4E162
MKTIQILAFLLLTGTGFKCYCQLDTIPVYADTLKYTALDTTSIDSISTGHFSEFLIPGNNGYILSRFGPRWGRMHYGTDIRMNKGDTIVAVESGTIVRSSWGTGFGNIVIVKHPNHIETYYGHLSKFLKKKGEKVKRGEAIALAGSTGNAQGVHLHFEIHENGKAYDPELVYDFKQHKIRNEARQEESLSVVHKLLRPKGYANKVAVPEFYSVRAGDSLWKISRKYKISINTICQLNHISANKVLRIGQPLRLY